MSWEPPKIDKSYLDGKDTGWNIIMGSCYCPFRDENHDCHMTVGKCSRDICKLALRKSKLQPGEYEALVKRFNIEYENEE